MEREPHSIQQGGASSTEFAVLCLPGGFLRGRNGVLLADEAQFRYTPAFSRGRCSRGHSFLEDPTECAHMAKKVILGESGGPTPVIDWEVAGAVDEAQKRGW